MKGILSQVLITFLINEDHSKVSMYPSSPLLYHQNVCIYPKESHILAMFSII